MTTSTVPLTAIAVTLLRGGMTTSSGIAHNVRTETWYGAPHICWNDDMPEPRRAPRDAIVQVTPESLPRPTVVATAQVHGGTRVVTLTTISGPIGHEVTLHAYDSNHPGDDKITLIGNGRDLDKLINELRAYAVNLLRPSSDDEACSCWAGWDPQCGRPCCWGIAVDGER